MISVDCLCNNYINSEPVITIDEASEIIGRKLTEYEYYSEIPNMGGIYSLTDEEFNKHGWKMSITKNGVFDEYKNEIFDKESVKMVIEKLQKLYEDYDEFYERYVNDYRERVINYVKLMKIEETMKDESKKKKSGYIYVMLHQGYYKIGKSADCERLGEYTRLAEEPEYVYVVCVNDMDGMERHLHELFQDKRNRDGRCEWFSLEQSDLDVIGRILEGDRKKDVKHTKGYRRYVLHECL